MFYGVLALIFGFIFYSWLCVLRESIRLINYSFIYLPVYDESHRFEFNFFFAMLSLIFANSLFITFYLRNDKSFLSPKNPRRNRILNDQIFLNAFYMNWMSRMFFVLGFISFGLFFSEFKFCILLLLLVLYLESWKTISLVIGKGFLKLKLLNLLVLIFIALIWANINVVDYKNLQEVVKKVNPEVNLPKSDFFGPNEIRFGFVYNMDVKVLNSDSGLKLYSGYNQILDWDDLNNYINQYKNYSHRIEGRLRISADLDTDMADIKLIEAEGAIAGLGEVYYTISDGYWYTTWDAMKGLKKPLLLCEGIIDSTGIPLPSLSYVDVNTYKQKFSKVIVVKIGKKVTFNGLLIPQDEWYDQFKNHVDTTSLFQYIYSKQLDYQDYINVLKTHLKAVDDLRKENVLVEYESCYEEGMYKDNWTELEEDQNRLIKDFPINVIEKIY